MHNGAMLSIVWAILLSFLSAVKLDVGLECLTSNMKLSPQLQQALPKHDFNQSTVT